MRDLQFYMEARGYRPAVAARAIAIGRVKVDQELANESTPIQTGSHIAVIAADYSTYSWTVR